MLADVEGLSLLTSLKGDLILAGNEALTTLAPLQARHCVLVCALVQCQRGKVVEARHGSHPKWHCIVACMPLNPALVIMIAAID